MQNLINGVNGIVELDTATPRVCLRRGESDPTQYQGYAWLPDRDTFPFFELRAAAEDLRKDAAGKDRTHEEMVAAFDFEASKKRIRAQFETLTQSGIRHAVLGAFGCGFFCNPAEDVAEIYAELIREYQDHFDVIAFAIFNAGLGSNENYDRFEQGFIKAAL